MFPFCGVILTAILDFQHSMNQLKLYTIGIIFISITLYYELINIVCEQRYARRQIRVTYLCHRDH